MNADSLLAATLALCCVLAVGAASSSLDDAVSTEPDDVIDIDLSEVPIGTDQAESIKRQLQGEEPTHDVDSATDGERDARASEASRDRSDGSDGESASVASAAAARASGRSSDRSQSSSADATPSDSRSILERLLAFLTWLLSVLPYLAVLGLLALAVAYRDRLAARLEGEEEAAADGGNGEWTLSGSPANGVSRAWYEMVSRLDLDQRRSKTPREYAVEASEAGADRDAVERLTETFERVRYGEERATSEREREAERWLDRIRSGRGGES